MTSFGQHQQICYIDTNIFLELEFQDARWEECREFLKKVETGEINARTLDYVVYGAILEIERKIKRKSESTKKIEIFLNAMSSMRGLEIVRPSIENMEDAAKSMTDRGLDYDDSYLISCMNADRVKTIVSFDKHFDKLKEKIERREPNEILRIVESSNISARKPDDRVLQN